LEKKEKMSSSLKREDLKVFNMVQQNDETLEKCLFGTV